MNRIEEIMFCLASADELREQIEKLAREEDYFRWRAAEQISEELATGKSQRTLAPEIGRSQAFVSFVARVWQRFGVITPDAPGNHRPRFQDAYRHIQQGRPRDLDGLVPLATDDDDARESKIFLMGLGWKDSPFWKDFKKTYGAASPETREELVATMGVMFDVLRAKAHGDQELADLKLAEMKDLVTLTYHEHGSDCLAGVETVTVSDEDLKYMKPCEHCYPR